MQWLMQSTKDGSTYLQAIVVIVLLIVSLIFIVKMVKGDFRVFTSPWREDYDEWKRKCGRGLR